MKKFTKLFLSCAAVAAVTAAVATTAMAAEITGDVEGTFNETDKTVTITTTAAELGADTSKPVTFLVYKQGSTADVAQDDVMGIDQGTAIQPENNGLKDAVAAPAQGGQNTYIVKVGYYTTGAESTFETATGQFKLGTPLGEEIIIGDTNLSGGVAPITVADSAFILRYLAEQRGEELVAKVGQMYLNTTDNETFMIGDTNLSGGVAPITVADSAFILRYLAEQRGEELVAKVGTTVMASPVAAQ